MQSMYYVRRRMGELAGEWRCIVHDRGGDPGEVTAVVSERAPVRGETRVHAWAWAWAWARVGCQLGVAGPWSDPAGTETLERSAGGVEKTAMEVRRASDNQQPGGPCVEQDRPVAGG